jgi:hypothetical protein
MDDSKTIKIDSIVGWPEEGVCLVNDEEFYFTRDGNEITARPISEVRKEGSTMDTQQNKDWEKEFDDLELRTFNSNPPKEIVVNRQQVKDFIRELIHRIRSEKDAEFVEQLTKLNDFQYSLMDETPIEVRISLRDLISHYSKKEDTP